LLGCVGEPLKRNVGLLLESEVHEAGLLT